MTLSELKEAVKNKTVRLTKTALKGGAESAVPAGETQEGSVVSWPHLFGTGNIVVVAPQRHSYLKTSRVEKIVPREWNKFEIETVTSFYELEIVDDGTDS